MDWFWNWGGECFGYREGDSLFTYYGLEVGRFDGEKSLELKGKARKHRAELASAIAQTFRPRKRSEWTFAPLPRHIRC